VASNSLQTIDNAAHLRLGTCQTLASKTGKRSAFSGIKEAICWLNFAVAIEANIDVNLWNFPSYKKSAWLSSLDQTNVISSLWVYPIVAWLFSTRYFVVSIIVLLSLSSYGLLRPLVNVWKLLPSSLATTGIPFIIFRPVSLNSNSFIWFPRVSFSIMRYFLL